MADPGAEGGRFARLGPQRAHRWRELLGLRLGPALAVGLIAGERSGQPAAGVAAFIVTFVMASLILRSPYPGSLLPVGRTMLLLTAPVLGALAAAGASGLIAGAAPQLPATAAILGGWIVLCAWLASASLAAGQPAPVRLAVIGSPRAAASLTRELAANRLAAHEVVGWFGDATTDRSSSPVCLGTLDELGKGAVDHRLHLLVYGLENGHAAVPSADVVEAIAAQCAGLPTRAISGGELYEAVLGRVPLDVIDGAWIESFSRPRRRSPAPAARRLADFLIGGAAAVLSIPLVAAAALAIKLDDGGAVLLRQRRVGKGGKPFTMLKLRTMCAEAEADGVEAWSQADDPRVTTAGRFLRRSHIDELPQLWNVLRGEMALVGPRPERPAIVSRLLAGHNHYQRRHMVSPGITGWAQIRCGYAGTEAGAGSKLSHDLFYLKHRSILSDILVMAETVGAVCADIAGGIGEPEEPLIIETAL